MKNKWHTKTLFLQNWKYYKWSYKYDNCIQCKTCKFKHKGNWLCSSCYDKKRKIKDDKRKFQLKKQNWKHYYKRRVLLFLEKKEDLRFWKRESNFDQKVYKAKWYQENYERIRLINKLRIRQRKWLNCLKMIIKWKDVYFPFEWIEKPSKVDSIEYEKYKENLKEFNILKKYYGK